MRRASLDSAEFFLDQVNFTHSAVEYIIYSSATMFWKSLTVLFPSVMSRTMCIFFLLKSFFSCRGQLKVVVEDVSSKNPLEWNFGTSFWLKLRTKHQKTAKGRLIRPKLRDKQMIFRLSLFYFEIFNSFAAFLVTFQHFESLSMTWTYSKVSWQPRPEQRVRD